MTFPSLQEKARKEWKEAKTIGGIHAWHELELMYLDKTIEETWNAAIQEAIGALLEENDIFAGNVLSYNECLEESRTRLEALLTTTICK